MEKKKRTAKPSAAASFSSLVSSIQDVDARFHASAVHAVNTSLTLRNWCIGAYIAEFELAGAGRARYGERLFESIADELKHRGFVRCSARDLRLFVAFYQAYPQVFEMIPKEVQANLPALCSGTCMENPVSESDSDNQKVLITGNWDSLSPKFKTPADKLVSHLSFTHIRLLLDVNEPLKRLFYEIECIKGIWSVRELKRQIDSQLFERTELSKDMAGCVKLANEGAEVLSPLHLLRDPFVFEFLGLNWKDIADESDFEDALVGKLEEFLLELGNGFCFEARQKHILIGGEYYSVDLVFYHRILKCHVLVDLKMGGFSYAHAGQMNMYLNWFRENMMAEGDNPPVGIVLCPDKSDEVVRYATAGLSNEVFVSKYSSVLPSPEVLEKFMRDEVDVLKEAGVVYRRHLPSSPHQC
ncbi:MAG TPA: PDDEXK nuclease domain-containing protein [Methanocorpusculum sp.]|nr:PDDEXK nuclease domain-containing protein [Methanocorpusculum sp.]